MNQKINLFIAACLLPLSCLGGELKHGFVNPNFGGPSFNAAPLLSNAQSQNPHTAPVKPRSQRSVAEDFQRRLERQVLSRLSRQLVNQAFGEDGNIQEGSIETGVSSIQVTETDGGATNIEITNNETGEVTVIEVPGV